MEDAGLDADRQGRALVRARSGHCKGNIVTHLTALRAIGPDFPIGIKVVAEGSEEQGTGGLEKFVVADPALLRSDAILVADCGNFAVGVPTFTQTLRGMVNVVLTVKTLEGPMHSGMFGGPAPDALAAMIQLLASLRDAEGNTTIDGLTGDQKWAGAQYPSADFRSDAGVLDGVDLLGNGTVSDMLWARPALTVLGMDVPAVVGSSAAIQPSTRARLNLRIPPAPSRSRPWICWRSTCARTCRGTPNSTSRSKRSVSRSSPPNRVPPRPLGKAMEAAYGRPVTTEAG